MKSRKRVPNDLSLKKPKPLWQFMAVMQRFYLKPCTALTYKDILYQAMTLGTIKLSKKELVQNNCYRKSELAGGPMNCPAFRLLQIGFLLNQEFRKKYWASFDKKVINHPRSLWSCTSYTEYIKDMSYLLAHSLRHSDVFIFFWWCFFCIVCIFSWHMLWQINR